MKASIKNLRLCFHKAGEIYHLRQVRSFHVEKQSPFRWTRYYYAIAPEKKK